MMKIFNFFFLAFFFLLSSCISEKEQEAAGVAAAMCGAEDYTISHSKSTGTGGSYSDLVVTFKHVQSKESNEKIASSSALNMFGMITKADYKDYDRIRIIVVKEGTEYEQAFEIKKLAATEALLKQVLNFFKKDAANTYQVPSELIDTKQMKDSTVVQFTNRLTQMENDYGRLSDVTIDGFAFGDDSGADNDALMVKIKAMNGSKTSEYLFSLSFESRKLMDIEWD